MLNRLGMDHEWNDLGKESAEATTIDCFKSRPHQSAVAVRRRDTPHWEFVDYVPDPDGQMDT